MQPQTPPRYSIRSGKNMATSLSCSAAGPMNVFTTFLLPIGLWRGYISSLGQKYVQHGSLSSVYIEYTSAIFKTNSPIANVWEDFCASGTVPRCDWFALNPHGRDQTPVWNGNVVFGQEAGEQQKQAALALNLDCLTAFGGCKDISELLPTIWKSTRAGAVSSRWRSMADSIEDASQPLPN